MNSSDVSFFQSKEAFIDANIEKEATDLGIKLTRIFDTKGYALVLTKRLGIAYKNFITPTGQAFIAKHHPVLFDILGPTLEELYQINPNIPFHAMQTSTLLQALLTALPEYQTEIEAFQSDIMQRMQYIIIRKLNRFLEHRAPSLMFSLEDGDKITLDWGNIAKSFDQKKAEETASLVGEACFFILPYLRSNEFYLRLVNNLSPCEGVCIF